MSAKESPSFIFRHLREEELPQWFDHLAECFPKTGITASIIRFLSVERYQASYMHAISMLLSQTLIGLVGKYYFEQHWQNDVDRSVERIYIAEEVGTGVIASTVKVRRLRCLCL